METKSSQARAYLCLVVTFVIWGSLYVVSNILLKSLPTFFIAFMRYLIAFFTMSVMYHVHVARMSGEEVSPKQSLKSGNFDGLDSSDRRELASDLRNHGASTYGAYIKQSGTASKKLRIDKEGRHYVFILGFCGYVVSVGLQLVGTKYAGSTMASLINALNPVAISLCAIPVLREKLTGNKAVGILLAVFGVYLIVGTGSGINIPGVILSLLSVITWALVSVFTREGLSTYDTFAVTRAAAGLAAACNFVLFFVEHFTQRTVIQVNLPAVLGILYIGIVCTGVAHIFWNQGLASLPASNCSALYPVQPLTSAIMGVIFFHEVIGLSFVVGAACIVAGVLICLLLTGRGLSFRFFKRNVTE